MWNERAMPIGGGGDMPKKTWQINVSAEMHLRKVDTPDVNHRRNGKPWDGVRQTQHRLEHRFKQR